MALTPFQRRVCRLIAENRIRSGESYIAGGAALNAVTAAQRLSQDIDLFHDTDTALDATWKADRRLLLEAGLELRVLRDRPGLVEAVVSAGGDAVRMEWARDSAFRFFPLVAHDDFGLTLHPVDLATNKLLALVGRREVRDWIDVITSDERIQPLGYLAWAASGKDPAFGPPAILEHAARGGRYTPEDIAQLAFEGDVPDAAVLGQRWHTILGEARDIVAGLPPEHVGTCVLSESGDLYRGTASDLSSALARRTLRFHAGRIRGALPQLRSRAASEPE